MCFSAEASFVASGVLAGTSLAISRLPKEKASIPLSLIPAIFATHQFIEGVVWLNQDKIVPDAFKSGAVFTYAFIAYVFWPIFIPFTAYLLESDDRRRMMILVCQGIGLCVGLSLLVSMIRTPVEVSVNACRLSYSVFVPGILPAFYLIAVCVPFLVSSRKSLGLFGFAVLVSCAATVYMSSEATFPSVWCFFAAVLSTGLYLIFKYGDLSQVSLAGEMTRQEHAVIR
jgi:hypothetical protein